MLVRVRSSKGTSRLDVAKDSTVKDLAYTAACDLGVPLEEVSIAFDFQGEQKVEISDELLVDCGINHGSMVYVSIVTPPINEEKDDQKWSEQSPVAERKDEKEQREEGFKYSSTPITRNEEKDFYPPAELKRLDTDEETRKLIEQLQKEDQEGIRSPQVRAPDPSRRMNLLAPDPIDEIGGTRWLSDDAYDPLRYGVANHGLQHSGTLGGRTNKIIDDAVVQELRASGVSEHDIMLMTQRATDEEIAKRYQEQDLQNSSSLGGMSDLEQARALHRRRMYEKGKNRNHSRSDVGSEDEAQERAMREVDRILSRVTQTAQSMRREFTMPHSSQGSYSSSSSTDRRGTDRNYVNDDNDDILHQLLMDGVLQETATGSYQRGQTPPQDYSRLEREWREEVNRLNANVDTSAFSTEGNEVDTDAQMQKAIEESVNELDIDFEKAIAASISEQQVHTIRGEVSIIGLDNDEDNDYTHSAASAPSKEDEDALLTEALAESMKDF